MGIVLIWGFFLLLVLLILAFDLGAFSRSPSRVISARQALFRTGVYFTLSCAFTVFVYFSYEHHWLDLGSYREEETASPELDTHTASWKIAFPFEPELHAQAGHGLPRNGQEAASMYFTGYLVEQSLSMDNIFVIALILGFFQVPQAYQHRVLFWGIMGALIMRGIMIGIGAALIHSFAWITYVFGAILVWTAWKMAFANDDHFYPEDSRILHLVRRFVHVHPTFDGEKFFSHMEGRWGLTPLALALLVVETTDVIFAVDSIPAVFGITHDPFLVFTSNVFAILGLRSLYFALADLLDKFRYLKVSLVVILGFVGLKMLSHKWVVISPLVSLSLIALALGVGIAASWWIPERPAEAATAGGEDRLT